MEFLPWVILGYAMYLVWVEVRKGVEGSRKQNDSAEIAQLLLTKQREHEAFKRIVMKNVEKQQTREANMDIETFKRLWAMTEPEQVQKSARMILRGMGLTDQEIEENEQRVASMSPDEIFAQRWRWYWERPKSRCNLHMATEGREEEGKGLGMEKGGEESHRA